MAGSQICRGFKVHYLIMCKSKVQGVVALGVVALVAPIELWVQVGSLESTKEV